MLWCYGSDGAFRQVQLYIYTHQQAMQYLTTNIDGIEKSNIQLQPSTVLTVEDNEVFNLILIQFKLLAESMAEC